MSLKIGEHYEVSVFNKEDNMTSNKKSTLVGKPISNKDMESDAGNDVINEGMIPAPKKEEPCCYIAQHATSLRDLNAKLSAAMRAAQTTKELVVEQMKRLVLQIEAVDLIVEGVDLELHKIVDEFAGRLK